MITRLDHCHWRNLRWVASGFVALVVIFSASYNPIDPGIGPGVGHPGSGVALFTDLRPAPVDL